jgi:hypothetical protein
MAGSRQQPECPFYRAPFACAAGLRRAEGGGSAGARGQGVRVGRQSHGVGGCPRVHMLTLLHSNNYRFLVTSNVLGLHVVTALLRTESPEARMYFTFTFTVPCPANKELWQVPAGLWRW